MCCFDPPSSSVHQFAYLCYSLSWPLPWNGFALHKVKIQTPQKYKYFQHNNNTKIIMGFILHNKFIQLDAQGTVMQAATVLY